MVRVMGAIMTGIIRLDEPGRFAAQLGTMEVNEEIDALKTLGISLWSFSSYENDPLVIMMPLLCVMRTFWYPGRPDRRGRHARFGFHRVHEQDTKALHLDYFWGWALS